MTHLTPSSWRRLRSGDASAAERAVLAAHLCQDCAHCDDVVAAADEPALDCAVDSALARLSRSATDTARLAALERRVLRALRPPRRPRVLLLAVPLAAAALVFIAGPRLLGGPPGADPQHLKGDPASAVLVAVAAERPGAPLEPVSARRSWPATAELYFTYTLDAPAYVYLARVGADGAAELFYPPAGEAPSLHAAGTRALALGGVTQAYALSGLIGRHRFVVVAAAAPLSSAALVEAVRGSGSAVVVEVSAP